jgi:hypothetical protein
MGSIYSPIGTHIGPSPHLQTARQSARLRWLQTAQQTARPGSSVAASCPSCPSCPSCHGVGVYFVGVLPHCGSTPTLREYYHGKYCHNVGVPRQYGSTATMWEYCWECCAQWSTRTLCIVEVLPRCGSAPTMWEYCAPTCGSTPKMWEYSHIAGVVPKCGNTESQWTGLGWAGLVMRSWATKSETASPEIWSQKDLRFWIACAIHHGKGVGLCECIRCRVLRDNYKIRICCPHSEFPTGEFKLPIEIFRIESIYSTMGNILGG